MNEKKIVMYARLLRFGVIYNSLEAGDITKEQASKLLAGCLTPGDESTRVDDSPLLDRAYEEACNVIRNE